MNILHVTEARGTVEAVGQRLEQAVKAHKFGVITGAVRRQKNPKPYLERLPQRALRRELRRLDDRSPGSGATNQ